MHLHALMRASHALATSSRQSATPRTRRRRQGLDPATLLKPPADSWPTYHGDYSGQRHSRLTQITPDNVHQLTLAWAFQTGPDAADQGARRSWSTASSTSRRRTTSGRSTRERRVSCGATRIRTTTASTSGIAASAVYKDSVYLTTPDAHLVALDANDGKVKWNVVIADSKTGYWSTNAPLVIRNHLIVGVSGDFDNLPGIAEVVRPGNRQAAVDVLQHAAARHARARSAAAPPAARCG